MRQIFVDLDGVLADLESYYEAAFSEEYNKDAPAADFWSNINDYVADGRGFFSELPLMSDALALWAGVLQYHPEPIILTGGGDKGYPETASNKRFWVDTHLGEDVPLICCKSAEKYLYGQHGDILIDDWSRYQSLWEDMGGVFILHTSAAESLVRLNEIWNSE